MAVLFLSWQVATGLYVTFDTMRCLPGRPSLLSSAAEGVTEGRRGGCGGSGGRALVHSSRSKRECKPWAPF